MTRRHLRACRSFAVLGLAALAMPPQAAAQPAASSAPAATTSAAVRLRPTAHVENCATAGCHADLLQHQFVHAPAAQHKCTACHAELEPRQHTFRSALPRDQLCAACHVLPQRDVVHRPVAVGDCTGCHDPHGSDHRMMLRADPATQLCLTCHDAAAYQGKKFVHGPVAAGACILCHEPHASFHAKLLKRGPQETCLTCHADVQTALRTARHVHPPVADGQCTACHDPHASNERAQLKGDGTSLCVGCHEPMRQRIASSAVVHGGTGGGNACATCHVGHASDLPRLQRLPQPAACLSCHDKPLTDAAGRTLIDMAAWLRDNPVHHGPIRDGQCTACHDPHAGTRPRLLTTDYPPEFYAPFDAARYALCFGCHRPEMVTSSTGRGVTGFRDGDRNLHFVHVNQEKGRTCRACHEVHASKAPFHIRDAVPFGSSNWMLEINFRALPAGGTCAPGCHKPMTYDRADAAAPSSQLSGGLP